MANDQNHLSISQIEQLCKNSAWYTAEDERNTFHADIENIHLRFRQQLQPRRYGSHRYDLHASVTVRVEGQPYIETIARYWNKEHQEELCSLYENVQQRWKDKQSRIKNAVHTQVRDVVENIKNHLD